MVSTAFGSGRIDASVVRRKVRIHAASSGRSSSSAFVAFRYPSRAVTYSVPSRDLKCSPSAVFHVSSATSGSRS